MESKKLYAAIFLQNVKIELSILKQLLLTLDL